MFSPLNLLASDYYGPAIAASCFVLFMSRVAEPARRTFNAILVAGSCGAYLNRGFGSGSWRILSSRRRSFMPDCDPTRSLESRG